MEPNDLLSELSNYWKMQSNTQEFEARLFDVCCRYPRLFDAVENRVVAQLIKTTTIQSFSGLSQEQFNDWVSSLRKQIRNRAVETLTAVSRQATFEEVARQKIDEFESLQLRRYHEKWAMVEAEIGKQQQLPIETQNRNPHAWLRQLTSAMLTRQKADHAPLCDFIQSQNITSLIHFTQAENLPSILKLGIVPRAHLPPGFRFNDQHRLDRFTEASSLSISFPNYRMFFSYQDKNQSQNWVVIRIKPDILLQLPCLFFPSNAASGSFRKDDDQALTLQMGATGLSSMFYESREIQRRKRGLELNWTTDPQAEVLVFGTINPKEFQSLAFKIVDPPLQDLARKALPGLDQSVGGKLFGPRNDYEHWSRSPTGKKHNDLDPEFLYGQ